MKKKVLLSIIIPCYNSEKTVIPCLDSVFASHTSFPFEVIAIDDASTDQTFLLLKSYQLRQPNLKVLKLDKNVGAGFARNKAIKKSKGSLIFSVDSDDQVSPTLFQQLADHLTATQADGVCASTITNFREGNPNLIAYTTEISKTSQPISPNSLFHNCPLFRNFLMTKSCFTEIGGYPTHHGFDTQGLAFRFLLNQKKAFVVPDSVYYQQVQTGKSYYVREYEKGNLSLNLITILEEFLLVFPEDIQEYVLNFPFTTENTHQSNVFLRLKAEDQLIQKMLKKIKMMDRQKIKRKIRFNKASISERYWYSMVLKRDGKVGESSALLIDLIAEGHSTQLIMRRLLENISSFRNHSLDSLLADLNSYIIPQPVVFSSHFHLLAVQLKNMQYYLKTKFSSIS